jgi:hypothetical protein
MVRIFCVGKKCSLSLSPAQEMEVRYYCKGRYISFMLHGVICRKTTIFILHAVRTSKLRQRAIPYDNTRQRTTKHSRLQLLVLPNAQPAASLWMLLAVIHRVSMRNTPAFAERYRKDCPELWGKSPLGLLIIMLQYSTMLRFSSDTMDISLKKPASWHGAWDRNRRLRRYVSGEKQ